MPDTRQQVAARFRGLPTREVCGRRVPVAVTRKSRLLGLAHLDPDSATPGLFIPRCRCVHTFGMRFALDLVFLGDASQPISVRHHVPRRRIAVERRARAVLELPASAAA